MEKLQVEALGKTISTLIETEQHLIDANKQSIEKKIKKEREQITASEVKIKEWEKALEQLRTLPK